MITNKDVLLRSIQLFAHGPAYQLPHLFANRQKSKKELECILNVTVPRIVIVSDLLGAGKSFLIDMATLSLPEKVNPLIIRWVNESQLNSRSHDRFIVIDEVDIKTPYRIIEKNLKLVNSKLSERANMLVLVGDYTLRNEKVLAIISNIRERKFIELEPLDKQFFLEAMKARVVYYLEKDEEIRFFDQDLLDYLIPRTEVTVATFREVFTILQGVVPELPHDTKECCITGREISSWFLKKLKHTFNEEQEVFYQWLVNYIIEEYDRNIQNRNYIFKTLETSTLRELCPIGKIASDEEYEETILKPFASRNILKSFGIPFNKGICLMDRYPGPYLPSVETFLYAKYGEKN